jgi:hypothetical protein
MTVRKLLIKGLLGSVGLAAGLLSLVALLVAPSHSFAQTGPIATVAKCGSKDRPETGLQGQTTLAERFGPGAARAFNCNLELVGKHSGDGSAWGLATIDKCAYLPQYQDPQFPPVLKTPGVAVLNVTNSANPELVKYLTTPAMINPSESLVLHPERRLLLGQTYTELVENPVMTLDIYDVSDCLNPVLKSSGVLPDFRLHNGDFAPDGMIFWSADCCFSPKGFPGPGTGVSALDISDPTHPKIIAKWIPEDKSWQVHAVSVSDDGKTAYATVMGLGKSPNGMVVLDISEVQSRSPNATIKMLSSSFWSDTGGAQYALPLTIQGRKYTFFTDLIGSLPYTANVVANFQGREDACHAGKPGWGYVKLIDVENPTKPVLASRLMLEVHDPANCPAIAHDPVFGMGYGSTHCDVDNYQDAKLIACGFFEGGLRVFDIRDVKKPREIAYYKPPAVWAQPRLASYFPTFRDTGPQTGPGKVHTADGVTVPVFAKDRKEIWFTSLDNGFQVVRFSDELMEREKVLFARPLCKAGERRSHRGCVQ